MCSYLTFSRKLSPFFRKRILLMKAHEIHTSLSHLHFRQEAPGIHQIESEALSCRQKRGENQHFGVHTGWEEKDGLGEKEGVM